MNLAAFLRCSPCVLAAVALVPAVAAALPPLLHHRLSEAYELPLPSGGRALPLECTGDSSDEILKVTPRHTLCLTLRDGAWIPLWHLNYPVGKVALIERLDAGGAPGVFVASEVGDGALQAAVYRIPAGEEPVLAFRLGPFLARSARGFENRRGELHLLGCLDVDGDGVREVLVCVYPFAPGTEPRRVLALAPGGDTLWSFPTAPAVGRAHLLARRDAAGRQLLVTSYSPANHFFWEGTSDTASYLYSLKPDGRPSWRVTTGAVHSGSRVALADLDGDHEDEIVVGQMWGRRESAAPGSLSVAVVDPADGRFVRSAALPAGAAELRAADLDRDGRPELLVAGQDERLYCLDRELKLLWKTEPDVCGMLVGVADCDGDGADEVVVAGGGRVGVLDARGRTLASRSFPTPLTAYLARLDGRPQVVVTAGEVGHVLRLEEPLPATLLFAPLLLVGIAGAAVLTRRRGASRAERLARAREAQGALLDAMAAFGHAGASLRVLDRLRYWLVNWERAGGQGGELRWPIPRLAGDFDRTVLPDLLRLASLARRARLPVECWRALPAHALAVSDGLRAATAGSGPLSAAAVDRALTPLAAVDGCLRDIRARLRETYRVEVVPLARRVLEGRQTDLVSAGCRARVVAHGVDGPAVFAAPEDLEKILDGLVDNALRALEGVADKQIEIRVESEGALCRIDFRDTGRGIAAADHERVFDRGYTTREWSGGFGLHFARESLARFEGRISVLASEPGAGTTFRLALRVAETAGAASGPSPRPGPRAAEDAHAG